MKPFAIALVAMIAAPALAQSAKPMSRADFEGQQTRKYQRYDLDRDGKLPAEELLKARPMRMDGSPYTLESVAKSLARKDANGDGVVTIAEAVASEMPRFEAMDADKNGIVSPEERATAPK